MKIENYTFPKSSFLSVEKDLDIIIMTMIKDERLKKLLYYNTKDCLDKANLTQEQTMELFGKNIKIVPKLFVDNSVENYVIINFDNFITNNKNPEFRNSNLEFDIICHFDQWQLKDFQLRPYRIAAEIDSLFGGKKLTGIGELEFISATYTILTDEYGGICLTYKAIHGEEDKKFMPNPADEKQFLEDFNEMYNK